jgi:hypothetical protein
MRSIVGLKSKPKLKPFSAGLNWPETAEAAPVEVLSV